MEKVDFRCAKWNAQADVIALRQDVFTYHIYNFEKKKFVFIGQFSLNLERNKNEGLCNVVYIVLSNRNLASIHKKKKKKSLASSLILYFNTWD